MRLPFQDLRGQEATLYSRDIELEALARKFGIQSYDGMDVGPAPKSEAASAVEHKD
jgi:hypothetical protein